MQWAFREYASGKPLKTIAEEMNAQGLRTPRNAKFSVNMLNKMLKNRAYIGEYHHGDIVVEGGMPVLVDKATFDRAQRRFAENKRKGSQRIRDQVFEYFVDKVYLYDDKLVVSMWFSEDDKQEITWRDWFSLDEYWTDESPFVKGGGVEFDCFPLGSTKKRTCFSAGPFSMKFISAQRAKYLRPEIFAPQMRKAPDASLSAPNALFSARRCIFRAGHTNTLQYPALYGSANAPRIKTN